jgi:predicted DNA-binding transcriptional regulator YafY
MDALLTRHQLLIRYTSFSGGKTLDRKVEPYRVFNLKGDWYLAAFDHRHAELRDFALARMRTARVLDERYEIPTDFRFEDYMGDSFAIEKGSRPASIAIRFSARQARWIRERRWHRSARIQERLDGGCVLRMRVAGLGEVKRWVMQFGESAEVLAPRALRHEVAQELGRAARTYAARTGRGR